MIIIVLANVMVLFLVGFSLGKTYSQSTIDGNTRIAKPIIKVENVNPISITNKNKKGTYEFKVKNYEEDEMYESINDVNMEYYVEILNGIDKSIEIKIFRNEQEIEIKNNRTETFDMKAGNKQEDNFKIEIQYNQKSNVLIEDIIQEIQIKVHSQQSKG